MKHRMILILLSNAFVLRAQPGDILLLPDDTVKVQLLLDLGYEYESRNPDSAVFIYEIAGKISRSIGYLVGYGRSLNYSGIVEFGRANYSQSERYYNESIEVFRKTGYQKGIAAAYNNIGNIYLQLGDFEKSMDNHLKGLTILEKLHDTVSLIYNLNNMGTMFFDNKQYRKAAGYYHESLRLSELIMDYTGITDTYMCLANTYKKIGDKEQSVSFLYKAIDLVNEEADPYGALLVYDAYSHHMSDSGKRSEALVYAKKALGLAYRVGNPYNICESLNTAGENYFQLSDYDEAERCFKQALDIALENNYLELLALIYLNRAQLMAGMNSHKKAYDEMTAFIKVRDTLFKNDRQQIIQELETKYQSAKKESMLAEQELIILEKDHKVSGQRSLIIWILITVSGIVFTLFLGITFIQQRRKTLYNRVLSLEKERELQSMKYLVEGEEKERSRLAKELHDGVNGSLGAIKLLAGSLTKENNNLNPEKWQRISSMIDQVSNEVRDISHNLMPDILVRSGLKEAIRSHIQKISEVQDIDIDFQCYGDPETVDISIKMTLYRVIQELLRNVLKHAGASECIIQLNVHEEIISLTVEDNGGGFDVFNYSKKTKPSGIGLHSIYSRVTLLGGKIDIQSALKTGTAVHIDIPVNNLAS